MKHAQLTEYLGVIVLAIVLVIILFFGKLSQNRMDMSNTEMMLKDFKNIFVSTSVTKFPFITEKGVSINELMGVYLCYRNNTADYGPGIGKINITVTIQKTLDELYGKGNWRLEINKSACITSEEATGKWAPYTPPFDLETTCDQFEAGEYITYEFTFPLSCWFEIASGKIYLSTGGEN